MKRNAIFILLFLAGGCVDIQLPDVSLIGDGPIVLPGTMSGSADSACPLWVADSGLRFILFQDARISNADFDAITTPGTSSRLSLSGRTDLGEPCVSGADHAVVTRILAIDGADSQAAKLANLRESAEQVIQDTKSALSARRDDITGNLRGLLDEVEASLEERKNEVRRTVDDVFESISDRLDDREPTRDRLNAFAEEMARKIDEAAGRLDSAKDQFSDDLRGRVDTFVDALRSSLDGPLAELVVRVAELNLDEVALEETLQALVQQVRMGLDARFDEKHEEIRMGIEALRQRIEAGVEALLDAIRDEITPDLPDPSDRVPPILDDLLPGFDEVVTGASLDGEALVDQVIGDLDSVADAAVIDLASGVGSVFEELYEAPITIE